MTAAVGYARVSTVEQGASGLGLEAQRQAMKQAAADRGWHLLEVFEDVASGRRSHRPGLQAALNAVASGTADVLVTAKSDRLSRSLVDLVVLIDRSFREGWSLVALDLGMDTTTPQGRAMAHVAGVFAELERELGAQRTREALAVKKAQGVKLGRPVSMSPNLRRRIKRMKSRGLGWTAIARRLNEEGVPTAQGGREWYPSTVRAMFVDRPPSSLR